MISLPESVVLSDEKTAHRRSQLANVLKSLVHCVMSPLKDRALESTDTDKPQGSGYSQLGD